MLGARLADITRMGYSAGRAATPGPSWGGGFKLKLVTYFLLLALVPAAAAFWGFSAVAKRSETRLVDARLHAGLRATLAAYEEELVSAERAANAFAKDPTFQRALADRDRRLLERLLADSPGIRATAESFSVGATPTRAAERRVLLIDSRGTVGDVIASVPLERPLLERLRRRSGLERRDHVVVVDDGRVVEGPGYLQGPLRTRPGRTTTASIAGDRYRALVAAPLPDARGISLGVLSPQSAIDAANARMQRRLLLGLLISLLLLALLAYVEGRAIVRTVSNLVDAAHAIARGRLDERVPVRGRDELAQLGEAFNEMANQLSARLEDLDGERRRLRDALSRFSEALAATHEPEHLLPAVVETAVEATGARGGALVDSSGRVFEAGEPDAGAEKLELPLTAGHVSYGTLLLFGDEFGVEERIAATSLASHAVTALDNARLHRIVERQALVDGLTGLANRRQCEEALAAEIARAERFESPLAIVIADLDDFKRVNDAHGHPVGDTVLREFAHVLRGSVREIDVAGRWGGEEFLLVLPGTDADGAVHLARRICESLAGHAMLTPEGGPVRVTASFGVAERGDGETGYDAVARADAALYEAKRSGKNCVVAAEAPVQRP